MSKLTALLTTLVLGSTASIAMASPAQTYDRRTGATTAFVDRGPAAHRYDGPIRRDRYDGQTWGARRPADDFGPRHYRTTWVALSSLRPTRGGALIEVSDPGTFTQLRLQTETGRARVDQLIVQFTDGSDQVVRLDRALSGFVDIPLDGNNRRIDRILVTGASAGRGDLQVFAI